MGSQQSKSRVVVEADADLAVRASLQDGAVCFSIYNYWSYPDLAWGNYTGAGAFPALTALESTIRLTNDPQETA